MKARTLALVASGLLAAVVLCVFWVDRPLALWLHQQPAMAEIGGQITSALQIIFGFDLLPGPLATHFVLFLLLLAAVALHARERSLQRAGYFYSVALCLLLTRFGVNALKAVFERLRPYDYVAAPAEHAQDFFVSGSSSFPSGHAAFYFGLLLPAALLMPRWRWPFLGLAALGAAARVLEGQHYLADVMASALVAALLAAVLIRLFHLKPVGEKPA